MASMFDDRVMQTRSFYLFLFLIGCHHLKFLQVVKNRFTGDLGAVPLHFNRATTSFSKKIYDKEKQLKKEKKQSLSKLEDISSTPPRVDEKEKHSSKKINGE